MSEKPQLNEAICDQFEKLRWHDSKLKGFCLYEIDNTNEVGLDIQWVPFPGRDDWIKGKVIFLDCTYMMADLDLLGKNFCADSIACGICKVDSELKHELQREQFQFEPGRLEDFFHFRIQLIEPGGDIHIFAKNFEVR